MAGKSTPRKKKNKQAVPAGYDSRLEYDLHKNKLKGWSYHPEERIIYEVPSTYEPDFVTEICLEKNCKCTERRRCGRSKEVLVEVKGRFRTRQEATKYIYIREALKQDKGQVSPSEQKEGHVKELVFLFQDADKPMPFAKKRKDGTKQTHGQWAEKNGFTYHCLKKGLPEKWLSTI